MDQIVEVWLHKLSQPIVHRAHSTYQKGDMFCIALVSGEFAKYPLGDIFRVIERYPAEKFPNTAWLKKE